MRARTSMIKVSGISKKQESTMLVTENKINPHT